MILIKKFLQVSALLLLVFAVFIMRHQYLTKQHNLFQTQRKNAVIHFNQLLAETNERIREEARKQAEEEKRKQQLVNSRSSSTLRPTINYSYTPGEYLGWFESTAYCTENYYHICNNGDATTTAMGTPPIPYQTIAVDPKVIPLGTKLIVRDSSGSTYHVMATDTGGAIKGKKIDMVCPTHQDAFAWGRRKVEIWIAN